LSKKNKFFADDGWAMWVDGDDVSTIYLNNWLNPKGKSYMDIAIHIRGIKGTVSMSIYLPFPVDKNEIEDISLKFYDRNLSRAIFSSMCLIDYKKNVATSEIAYNGKTVDIVHLSAIDYTLNPVSKGTLLKVNFAELAEYLDNDEAYFMFRVPHKSVDDVFKKRLDVGNVMTRMRDLLLTPMVTERYGYSVRINEARLLPDEINNIGAFHRQKLKKAILTISIDEGYELNDNGCYRIRRMEEDLYKDFLPKKFPTTDAVTYQWQESREINLKGQFNFYMNIYRQTISKASMFVYMILFVLLGASGNACWDLIKVIYNLIF
jgi:hypothetical protein